MGLSRRKPNWVELVDGPCAGKRAIAPPDCRGEFVVEHFRDCGALAKAELHVYRVEAGPRGVTVGLWVRAV